MLHDAVPPYIHICSAMSIYESALLIALCSELRNCDFVASPIRQGAGIFRVLGRASYVLTFHPHLKKLPGYYPGRVPE